MREEEFKKFYKRENNLKNLKEAEEKIELFWSALMEGLKENERVIFKSWGKFEIKEVKSRKIKIPKNKESFYTIPKKIITFKSGKDFRDRINKEGKNYE